ADLLASDHLKFVRACESKTCQWLFLDMSRNHRRRWCKMNLCGNRAKARRFYARQKKKRRINLPESTEPDLERCGVGRGRGPRTARSTSRFTIVKLLMSARR